MRNTTQRANDRYTDQLLMICKYLWSSSQSRRAQQTETIAAPPRWQSTKWWACVLFCSHFFLFLSLLVFVHMCSGLGVPQRAVRGQVHMPSKLNHQVLQVRDINVNLLISTHRLGICRDRRDRRSCKIFVSCVNFSRKQRSFLHILQVYTHLNVNFLHNC